MQILSPLANRPSVRVTSENMEIVNSIIVSCLKDILQQKCEDPSLDTTQLNASFLNMLKYIIGYHNTWSIYFSRHPFISTFLSIILCKSTIFPILLINRLFPVHPAIYLVLDIHLISEIHLTPEILPILGILPISDVYLPFLYDKKHFILTQIPLFLR